jgi:hypothetical protein
MRLIVLTNVSFSLIYLLIYLIYLASSFVNLFQIYKLRHRITSYNNTSNTLTNVQYVYSFISVENGYYAFMHYINTLVVFNKYWENINYFQISTDMYSFAYGINIDNEFYFSGNNGIKKRDKYMNLTKQYIQYCNCRAIVYNKTNNLIYVADTVQLRILILDRNLSFVSAINTTGYTPYGLAVYDDKLYVGTVSGSILVIQGGIIVKNFTTPCVTMSKISIDDYCYMLLLCQSPAYVYLFHTNGTDLKNGITASGYVRELNFDLERRLVITSDGDMKIYY